MSLKTTTDRSIELSHNKLTQARRSILGRAITSIAETTFSDPELRKQWVALIGVESGYDGRARSPKGAVGLGQLIPKYRDDFGADCGLTGLTVEDITDDYTNLMLSSCYFQYLVRTNGGDSSLAMVAYVAGPYSDDLAKARKGQQTGTEATEYVKAIHKKKAAAEVSE